MPQSKHSHIGLMEIIENIGLVEDLLNYYKKELGKDYHSYKNHVYRIINLCRYLHPDLNEEHEKKVFIAACFHDLGIWTNDTFDYLLPSIEMAKNYLISNHLETWGHEIALMINLHHKFRSYTGDNYPLVEVFRRADWIDVSLGVCRFGLQSTIIQIIKNKFPNSGFHKRLFELTAREFLRNPFRPLPMMKW